MEQKFTVVEAFKYDEQTPKMDPFTATAQNFNATVFVYILMQLIC